MLRNQVGHICRCKICIEAMYFMSPNRRIFLNIVATCGWSLCAGVCEVVVGRWVLAAEKSDLECVAWLVERWGLRCWLVQ